MTKIGRVPLTILNCAVLFFAFSAVAELKVVATVDPGDKVAVGDAFVYSISVVADGNTPDVDAEPHVDSLGTFQLIQGTTSTQSKSTFVNGKFTVQQTKSFDYQLQATKAGTFELGPATIGIGGKKFTTNKIKMTVTAAPSGGGGGGQARRQQQQRPRNVDPFQDQADEMEDMFNQLLQRHTGGRPGAPGGGGAVQPPVNVNDAFYISVDVDKKKVYAGEQVTASWYLYTRGQIADIDTLKYPDLKGFWKEEIDMATRLNFQQVVVNGVVWNRALLVAYALFPIKAGMAVIDPYKAKCTVVIAGPFGFGKSVPSTKQSTPVNIEVMEIPTAGRPPEFSGAVGQFKVDTTIDQQTAPANQPLTMKVKFAGRGNAKLIDLPPLTLPPQIEVYSQKSEAKYFKDGNSHKEFEILLIPREPGQYEIPPLKAAYFDPVSSKFETVSSTKLNIVVTPGKPGDQPALPPQAAATSKPADNSPLARDGLSLSPPLLIEDTGHSLPAGIATPMWAGLYALLFGFLGFRSYIVVFRKPKKESLLAAVKKRARVAGAAIDKGDYRKVGVELTNSIYMILGAITEQGGANLEFNKLMDAASPSLRRELSGPLRAVLDRTEELGFAPENMLHGSKQKGEMKKLLADVENVLNKAIALSERKD